MTAREHLTRALAAVTAYRQWIEQPPGSHVAIESKPLRLVEADITAALAIVEAVK